MRGRKKNERLKSGRTIAGEREQAVPEFERIQEHQKTHHRHVMSVLIVVVLFGGVGWALYLTIMNYYVEKKDAQVVEVGNKYEPTVPIIDEDSRAQISSRTKEYIGKLEKDFQDLGYKVAKVTLPTGMTRGLYVDLEGYDFYIKVNLDRDTAVSAEDAVRMLKYLATNDLHPQYVDVRIEGKGYYK